MGISWQIVNEHAHIIFIVSNLMNRAWEMYFLCIKNAGNLSCKVYFEVKIAITINQNIPVIDT